MKAEEKLKKLYKVVSDLYLNVSLLIEIRENLIEKYNNYDVEDISCTNNIRRIEEFNKNIKHTISTVGEFLKRCEND